MAAEIIKVLWDWAPECIMALVRACIQLGHHPESWKVAKGVVIPKPGKPEYKSVRAHRVNPTVAKANKLHNLR